MALLDEIKMRKDQEYDLGKRKIRLKKDVADALDFVIDNSDLSVDEVIEAALEKLPIKKLVKEIESAKKKNEIDEESQKGQGE